MKGARALTEDEIRRTLDKLTTWRDRLMLCFCLYTGARISEALAMPLQGVVRLHHTGQGVSGWTAVDQVVLVKRRTKGKRHSRAIAMHEELAKAIDRYMARERTVVDPATGVRTVLEPNGPLFLSRSGGSLSRSQGWRVLSDALEDAAVRDRVSSHSLRKTFAQEIYRETKDLVALQELLGHSSIQQTREYVGVDEDAVHRAVRDSLPGDVVEQLQAVPQKTVAKGRARQWCTWVEDRAAILLRDRIETRKRVAYTRALREHRGVLVPGVEDRAEWVEARVKALVDAGGMTKGRAQRRARAEWLGRPIAQDAEQAAK